MRDVRTEVKALLRQEFDLGDVALDDTTRLREDLLLDSLDLVELAMVVEDALDVGIADEQIAVTRTFGDLWRCVADPPAVQGTGDNEPHRLR